jgi:hypothetical protein
VLDPAVEGENRLTHSSKPNKVGSIKMKNLPVWFDRIALCFPGFEAAFQNLILENCMSKLDARPPGWSYPATSTVNVTSLSLGIRLGDANTSLGALREPGITSE